MLILACASLITGVLVHAQPVHEPEPDQPATQERLVRPAGPFEHALADVTLRDGAREKDVELRVRVPRAVGERASPPEAGWPLVVFSHGAGGARDAFPELQEFWASHGYVTIAITHEDSIELRRRDGGGPTARELMTESGRRELLRSVRLGDRVADASLVLDRLGEISTLVEGAGGPGFAIDRARMAIAGHSAGAFTAQLCAGVRARSAGVGRVGLGFTSIAEPRFSAAIVISGQGTTSRILGEESWSAVGVPMLVIAGSLDVSPSGMGQETPESRRHPYERSRGVSAGGPPAYLMFIDGATHASYSGTAGSKLLRESPTTDAEWIADAVEAATTLFLDAHLRQDASARACLESGEPGRCIPGKIEFEHK